MQRNPPCQSLSTSSQAPSSRQTIYFSPCRFPCFFFFSVIGANPVMWPPYCLLSLSMFSRFIHVVVCVSTYFFVLVSTTPLMENNTFTPLSVDGICFHLFHQYKQRCCENTCAKWVFFFSLLDIEIQDLRCGVMETDRLFPKVTAPLQHSPAVSYLEASVPPPPCQHVLPSPLAVLVSMQQYLVM